jgi:hypothetical protein
MIKSKIYRAVIVAGLFGASAVVFGGVRTVAIDDINPASYETNGYAWGTPALGSTSRSLNFTMRIGATTIGAAGTTSFRVFEDGYVVLGSGVIANPISGLDYSAGAALTDIQGAGGQPLFVISPFYSSLSASLTIGAGTYQNGELSSNLGDVAEYRLNPPVTPPPTGVPPPYLLSDKKDARWGKASWYGLTGTEPGNFYGQVELRDVGTAEDGNFDFSIRFEGFASSDFPSDGAGVGGFSFGGVKYSFNASDLAGVIYTDFEVRNGGITGFGADGAGNTFSKVFLAADDPGGNGVPSPAILALLAIGGLGFTRLQRKKG